jgi:uncharacterized protein (DUF2235 family)
MSEAPEQIPSSGRNLIICCDGTNNEFGKENTNVVRLVEVLERTSGKQRIFYDPGVGTLPNPGAITALARRLSEYWELAFATDLPDRVARAYQYLMDHWQPGDRVFLFGFSRGAFTVRVLAGLLNVLGLMPSGGSNLLPYVLRLFKSIRGDRTTDYWKVCEEFRWTFARPVEGSQTRQFPVHFLGVWDTVSSVGWVWDPPRFPYSAYNPAIRTVRHAVSIDERRAFFRQNLIKPAARQDLMEIWFSGVHCDVGGGYPVSQGSLWRVAFDWMWKEAEKVGLVIDQKRLSRVLEGSDSERPWAGTKHESLTWAWWPAEFFPKLSYSFQSGHKVPYVNCGRHRYIQDGALIHGSALARLQDGELKYDPPNLDQPFRDFVRKLGHTPDQLHFWRRATMENFQTWIRSRVAEIAHPYEFAPEFENKFDALLDASAAKTQAEGLPDNYEKFSEASRSMVTLVSEMRDYARRNRLKQLNEEVWERALQLCPLWPFC